MLSEMPRDEARAELTRAMQAAGVLADPIPADDAALAARWIDTFLEAFGTRLETVDAALDEVRAALSPGLVGGDAEGTVRSRSC